MEKKILEVNVDDLNMGVVYGLVKNVIINNENRNIQIDIASIEHFANRANIDMFNSIGTHVFYVGYEGNKSGNISLASMTEQYNRNMCYRFPVLFIVD